MLVDDSGDMLASLRIGSDGQPMFSMWEKAGAGTTDPNDPRLWFSVVSTSKGGGAWLSVGRKEQGEVFMRSYRDGTPAFMQIYRTGGAAIWSAP